MKLSCGTASYFDCSTTRGGRYGLGKGRIEAQERVHAGGENEGERERLEGDIKREQRLRYADVLAADSADETIDATALVAVAVMADVAGGEPETVDAAESIDESIDDTPEGMPDEPDIGPDVAVAAADADVADEVLLAGADAA